MKWISVKKRMPTLSDVFDHEMGGTSDFCLVFSKGNASNAEMALFHIDRRGVCTFELEDQEIGDWFVVTHWMYIEQPEE